jgi:hypothetical protein
MMWHVVFAELGQLARSGAARSRDAAIRAACERHAQSCDVRRIIEPNGTAIGRAKLDEHYDGGHCTPTFSLRFDEVDNSLIPEQSQREASSRPLLVVVNGTDSVANVVSAPSCCRSSYLHPSKAKFVVARSGFAARQS